MRTQDEGPIEATIISVLQSFYESRTGLSEASHVGKYDQADDRPKLTMLTIDIGPMIDRGLDDNYGPILACYICSKIAPDDRPRIIARVKPMTFQIYNDINNDSKI